MTSRAPPNQVHQLILGALSTDSSCPIATMLGVSVDQYQCIFVSSPKSRIYIAANQITKESCLVNGM